MTTSSTLADFLNDHGLDATAITRASVDFADYQAGNLGVNGMYNVLVTQARDAAGVDQMLYQLTGDPLYAEQAALIVLSAAWNHAAAVEPLKRILLDAATSQTEIGSDRLATSVLYGMYRIARDSQMHLQEVTFRGPSGAIESRPIEGVLTAATLFDAVRDLY
jgi:hypothetical protein